MTALGMTLAGIGAVLVWSGVKGEDPRKVFLSILTTGKVGTTPGRSSIAPGSGPAPVTPTTPVAPTGGRTLTA